MNRFLLKILFYIVLMVVIITPFSFVNKILLSNMLNSDAFKLDPRINTLIIGDSHTEVSLNPTILTESVNVSSSGESLFYTYYKLRHFFKHNPTNIKNVILAFSYHDISKKYQEDYLYEVTKSDYSFKEYYIYLDRSAKKKIVSSSNYITYMLKYDFGLPIRQYKDLMIYKYYFDNVDSNIKGFGGFRSGEASNLNIEKIKNKINTYFYDENSIYTGISKIMENSLYKIVSLCEKNNAKLYLFNSPLHVSYRSLVPKIAYMEYHALLHNIKESHRNMTIYDISKQPLDDLYFSDGDHLNRLGSQIVSHEFQQYLTGFE